MGIVHYAYSNRALRYIEQYDRHVEENNDIDILDTSFHNLLAKLVYQGKIKKTIASAFQQASIDNLVNTYCFANVLRQDEVTVKSKLSSNYDPIYTTVAYLTPGKVTNTVKDYTSASLGIDVHNNRISKEGIICVETNTGIYIQRHCLARLEERGITNDAIFTIVTNIGEIIKYSLVVAAAYSKNSEIKGFAFPLGEHLLVGKLSGIKLSSDNFRRVLRMNRHEQEVKSPPRDYVTIPYFDIRTAYEYNSMTSYHDEIREQITALGNNHIENINVMFDTLFTTAPYSHAEYDQAVEEIARDFAPITNSIAWKKFDRD